VDRVQSATVVGLHGGGRLTYRRIVYIT